MADIERALVGKIAQTGRIQDVIARGIRDDLFADDQCRALFVFQRDHALRYGAVATIDSIRTHISETRSLRDFELSYTEDALEYLIDRFIVMAKRRLANQMVEELALACDDPERSENIDLEFLEVSRKLATLVPSSEVAYFKEGMKGRIEEQERRQKEGIKFGIPLGFPTLDNWTGGIQPHEFVTVAGFSGLGKSTFLISSAFNVFMQGYRPLYISLEMERQALLRKWDAMAAALDYHKMKQLELPREQIKNWRKTQERIANMKSEIPVIDSIRHCTPDHIFAEAVRHKPDMIVVDYITLMRSAMPSRNSSPWQSVTEITQDLKQIARTLKIPILAAAQTNRAGSKDGAELDNIAQSISIVQDSDIVIGLYADEIMREQKEIQIRLRKNRDGRIGEFQAIWNHEEMVYREKTEQDRFGRPGNKEVEEPQRATVERRPRPRRNRVN